MEDNKILDDLFRIRREDFDTFISQKYKETKISHENQEINTELKNFIQTIVTDEENQKQLFNKIEIFHDCVLAEMEYWCRYNYKFGVTDGIKLDKEIKEQIALDEK